MELDQAGKLTDGIIVEHDAEAMQLLQCVIGISSALADLGILLI
jgi:hypothetical protein